MQLLKGVVRFRRERRGMLTGNFGELGGFLKTRPELAAPDIQIHMLLTIVDDHGRKLWSGRGFGCHVCLLRPKSRGSVRLASVDVDDAPLIDINFLGEEEDLEGMVTAFKFARRLMDTPAFREIRKRDVFTDKVVTDDEIRQALKDRVDTVYHPVGSCKMGENDPMAVVDSRLRVHGMYGLRIADASIMPSLIGGNTNACSIMIGERAADFIKTDREA